MEEVYKERFGNSVCTAKQPPQIMLKLTRKRLLKEKGAAVVHNNDRRPAFFSHCMSVSSFFMTSFRDGMHGRKPTSKVFTLLSVFDDVHLHGGSLFFVK